MVFGAATAGETPVLAPVSPEYLTKIPMVRVPLRNACKWEQRRSGPTDAQCAAVLAFAEGPVLASPRHARAEDRRCAWLRVAPPHPSPRCAPRLVGDCARSGRESRVTDRTRKRVWGANSD